MVSGECDTLPGISEGLSEPIMFYFAIQEDDFNLSE